MDLLKGVLTYLLFFVIAYIIYFVLVVLPHSKSIKKNKNKKYPPELQLLRDYYKVNVNKIGVIKTLRIINFVNALMFAALVMIVFGVKQQWLKIIILAVLIIPSIWCVYYFLAKILKLIERKRDNE